MSVKETIQSQYLAALEMLSQLQFYNIRHIQHHAGELYNRLQEQVGGELKWIGMKPTGDIG